jgi:phage terminase small subunit
MGDGLKTKLTPRERCFVDEYLVDLNGTRAAVRAGYTEASARTTASELLTKPDISAAVSKALEQRSRRTKLRADKVIRELERLAFSDIADAMEWGTKTIQTISGEEREYHGIWLKESKDIPASIRVAIKEVSEVRGKDGLLTTKIQFHDKIRPLELLGKHLGVFPRYEKGTEADDGDENSKGKTLNLKYSPNDPEGRK